MNTFYFLFFCVAQIILCVRVCYKYFQKKYKKFCCYLPLSCAFSFFFLNFLLYLTRARLFSIFSCLMHCSSRFKNCNFLLHLCTTQQFYVIMRHFSFFFFLLLLNTFLIFIIKIINPFLPFLRRIHFSFLFHIFSLK